MRTVAMILAGGAGTRLGVLAETRAKPAVPFGGKYRIIDFTLSNCARSEIRDAAVLTQHFPRSLDRHIGVGRPWDFDRRDGGIVLLAPYHGQKDEWYNGTAQAVFQNWDFLDDRDADTVLILCGDHVYTMDYRPLLRTHRDHGADLTVAVSRVDAACARSYGILSMDEDLRILTFEEKPEHPRSNLASMGVYVFTASALRKVLEEVCGRCRNADFGRDVVPRMLASRAYAYPYEGYWRDVGSLEEYWKASMELTLTPPPLDLYGTMDHAVYTNCRELPPAKFGGNATVVRSVVAEGCRIDGTVEDTVLSPGVVVEEGAVVRRSVVFDRTVVRRGAVVDRAILDKGVIVGEGCRVGSGTACEGLTVVRKAERIPAGAALGPTRGRS